MTFTRHSAYGNIKSVHPAATLLFLALTASSFASVVSIVLAGTRLFLQNYESQADFSGMPSYVLAGNAIACAGKCALNPACVAINWIPTSVSQLHCHSSNNFTIRIYK